MSRILSIIVISLAVSSCATITRGTTQPFTVTSSPSAAEVRISNGLTCITPCTLEVKRKPGFIVSIEKPGYTTVNANVVSTISGGGGTAMAGNILLGGIIGAAVDGSNGAMNELTPNPLHVFLEADSAPETAD